MKYSGKTALVTGASAGIGTVFAHNLAAKNTNLILAARRTDRLNALKNELVDKYGVKVFVAEADLTDPAAPEHIVETATQNGFDVDILINNAGWGLPGQYTDNEWPDYRDYLQLMVTSYAHLVRLVLPGMLERNYGRIIQVASLAGLMPGSSGHTLYGASKAFIVGFSQSIAAECDGRGVHVTALCPGFTYSEFHDVNGARDIVNGLPQFMFQQPEPVVASAFRAVEKNHVVCVPGALNKSIAWAVKALPRPWAANLFKGQSERFRRQDHLE